MCSVSHLGANYMGFQIHKIQQTAHLRFLYCVQVSLQFLGGELGGGMLFQLHPAALHEEKHRPHRLESALWIRPRSLVGRVTVGSPAPHS